jgi:hypothetical protein
MEMRIILVAVLLLVAGCFSWSWDDVPGAEIRPVSEEPTISYEEWSAAVLGAVTEWDDALEAVGCPAPFSRGMVTSGAHPVYLVAYADWTEDDGLDGITYGDGTSLPPGGIHVRNDEGKREKQWRSTLLHEMGHAIGLDHAPAVPKSVMCEGGGCGAPFLTEVDVARAACELGCGVCD